MIERVHSVGQGLFRALQKPMSRALDSTANPFNHLGALTIFFCWVVLVSGIWLLIFFSTSVSGAFDSVEYLTNEQWYLGGVMRSLHRYASDAAIVTIFVHILKEFMFNHYRRNRWFTWVTGVPLVWIIFPLGITGYWLVWDELAQYVAISSAELMDSIPIFTDSMAGNFLNDDQVSDRFFTPDRDADFSGLRNLVARVSSYQPADQSTTADDGRDAAVFAGAVCRLSRSQS